MDIQDELTLVVWEQYLILIDVTQLNGTGNETLPITIIARDRPHATDIAATIVNRLNDHNNQISWVGTPDILHLGELDPIDVKRKLVLNDDGQPRRRIRTPRRGSPT